MIERRIKHGRRAVLTNDKDGLTQTLGRRFDETSLCAHIS
jgi:hypothetical protein